MLKSILALSAALSIIALATPSAQAATAQQTNAILKFYGQRQAQNAAAVGKEAPCPSGYAYRKDLKACIGPCKAGQKPIAGGLNTCVAK